MDAAAAESRAPKARPRHRRAEIAENASELFSARGFHAVRMEDIAEASNITARALYRHYQNKQALLSHVVLQDQQRLMETFADLAKQSSEPRGLDASLTAFTEAALDSRRLSLLWQREARHLDPDNYRLVRRQARSMAKQVEALVVNSERDDFDDAVADIRSWAVVSIMTGTGLYESTLSRQRLAQDLIAAGKRVINAPVAEGMSVGAEVDRTSSSRREQLIYAAASAFRNKGFAGVSIDDIGGQLGIVGPALYRYFDNKAEILVATMNRLDEWLALEMSRAMRLPCPDEAVIVQLVHGYIRIALEATDLLAVSLTERLYLPGPVVERFDRVQADYISEWQRWMSVARPELPDTRASTLVRAAKTIIDDCVRIPHLRQYKQFPAELTCAALATLGLDSL
ncbi:TetR/AcrR family transcriptional regulator [Antrihabitans stalactiti]|uniref:TetR/AcrR family transcriptional regulator n=1 Tax=Antrihabitans stalactiti TaxID=2584121 RepID=A0A848KGY7_9NOCA|nr:TetR/AcrR family transcriptional regulator [Antrihabitans stalactiti]NMN97539.1 TetR/AcrR family transcriptional regulator [Antrihabitans stalactiti]